MKLLRKLFPLSLFLFSLSVTMTLYDMATAAGDVEASKLLGLPLSFFMLPLLAVNLMIMAKGMSLVNNIHLTKCVAVWIVLIPLITVFNSKSILTDLIRVLMWTTSYFASYIMVLKNENYERYIYYTFTTIFFMGCFFFFKGKETQLLYNDSALEVGVNAVFCVLTVLPFVLLAGNQKLSIIAISLTIICVIFSNKRSASIIAAIALVPTVYSLFSSIKSSFIKNLLIVVVVSAFSWLFIYVSNNYLGGRIFERFEGLSEDGGSGRDELWKLVLYSFFNSNIIEFLFGHGHNAVAALGLASASHNDFLDVVYDYGVIAFVIYLSIHMNIIKTTYNMWRSKCSIFGSYFFMNVVFIVMSFISILIVQQRYLIYIGVYWGMIEALRDNDKLTC